MDASFFSKPELLWFIIGLVLFLLELVVPGFVIFFFGIGAWVTALICLIANPGTDLQMLIFAITSVLALSVLRRMIQKRFFFSKDGLSEQVEDEFTGKTALALTDIGPGIKGKIDFKGTTWTAHSDYAIKEGQYVIIKEKESINITVEPKKQ